MIALTAVFEVIFAPVEDFISNILLKSIESVTTEKIIKKAEKRLYNKLHDLVDANDDTIIASEDFKNFYILYAKDFFSNLIDFRNVDLTDDKNNSEHLEKLIKNFKNFSIYEDELDVRNAVEFIYDYYNIVVDFKKELLSELNRKEVSKLLEIDLTINYLKRIEKEDKERYDDLKDKLDFLIDKKEKSIIVEETTTMYLKKCYETTKRFSALYKKDLPFEEENIKTLDEIFVFPEYRLYKNNEIYDNIEDLIYNFLSNKIKKFLRKECDIHRVDLDYNYLCLFILGFGGIGKSSLVERIAYNVQKKWNGLNGIFIKFSELGEFSGNLLNDIIKHINIEKKDLKNSVLILDAFDELSISFEYNKNDIIENFLNELNILGGKAIVTSRKGYGIENELESTLILELLTFNREQRKRWLNKYNKELSESVIDDILNYHDNSDTYGNEFVGIPVILYLIASNNLSISKYSTKFELYNDLFGRKGIWVKRKYDIPHPGLIKKYNILYDFVLNVASEIFIGKNKCISIEVDKVIQKNISEKKDIKYLECFHGIVCYFNTNKLKEVEFSHRSIYEFFVAQSIVNMIKEVINENDVKKQYEYIFRLLAYDLLNNEICYFIEKFIDLDEDKYFECSEKIQDSFNRLLKKRFMYTNNSIVNTDSAYNSFSNTVKIYNILLKNLYNSTVVDFFVKYGIEDFVILTRYFDLKEISLTKYNFSKCNLSQINFKNTDLSESIFTYAKADNAVFFNSNLRQCDFKYCNLFGSIFGNANLSFADLRYANLNNCVMNKEKKNYYRTKINLDQLKYFLPQIYNIFYVFEIYKDNKLATDEEITEELNRLNKIRLEYL